MQEAHAGSGYKSYWAIWVVLLVLTVVMLKVSHQGLIIAGIAIKSGLIAMWFMHLKFEKTGLIWAVVISIVATTAVLFGLIAVDARVS